MLVSTIKFTLFAILLIALQSKSSEGTQLREHHRKSEARIYRRKSEAGNYRVAYYSSKSEKRAGSYDSAKSAKSAKGKKIAKSKKSAKIKENDGYYSPPVDAEHWPPKLIHQVVQRNKRPTTTSEAADLGWIKTNDPCNPLLGEAWVFGGERGIDNSVSLYFTPQCGSDYGVLSAIEVDYYGCIEENLVGTYFTEERTSKDGTYRSVSVALREGNLCDTKRPAAPGNDPYLVISPDMAHTIVPAREDSPELLSNWKEGSCIIQMGYHWATDVVGGKDLTYKTENLVPVVPMYSSTDKTINGIFFAATEQKQNWPSPECPVVFNPAAPPPEALGCIQKYSNFWDEGAGLFQLNKPFLYMCSNFCGDCAFTGSNDGFLPTTHFFFKDVMVNGEDAELCSNSEGRPIYCRSGEYPTMVASR